MDRSDGSLLALAFILIATSLLSQGSIKNDYEKHTPYPGGVITPATISDIKTNYWGRYIRSEITVDFKDGNGRTQQAILEGSGDQRFRIGNVIEISYPTSSTGIARWPAGRRPDSERYLALKTLRGILFAGFLCLLAIPAKRLFGSNENAGRPGLHSKSSYVLKLSYGRVLLNVVLCTFGFGLLYVTIYLLIFYLTGRQPGLSAILMIPVSALFLFAIWKMVKPAIGHYPLVLTRSGFSVYDSGEIPWREVSEIEFVRLRRAGYALRFYLADHSKAEPRQRRFGNVLEPHHIVLSLESSNWVGKELKDKLIYFALRGRDDAAAATLRHSTDSNEGSSGTINWPQKMDDATALNTEIRRSGKEYMSTGFHLNNH